MHSSSTFLYSATSTSRSEQINISAPSSLKLPSQATTSSVAYAARKGGGRCRASMKMSPFLLDRNVPLLRPEDPIPSCDDCAACSGTRQDYPAARATTARGLDGTAASRNPIFLIRGNGNSWNPLH